MIVLGAHGHGVVWLAVATVQLSAAIWSGEVVSPADAIKLEVVLNGQACTDTKDAFFDAC